MSAIRELLELDSYFIRLTLNVMEAFICVLLFICSSAGKINFGGKK